MRDILELEHAARNQLATGQRLILPHYIHSKRLPGMKDFANRCIGTTANVPINSIILTTGLGGGRA